MPLTQREKLLKSQLILNQIYERVGIVKERITLEDKTRHGVLGALRLTLGSSSDMIERFKRTIATCVTPDGRGVGACSNLSSYFAWLYMCETQMLDVTLVCLSLSGAMVLGEPNHLFVLIGPANLGRPPLQTDECQRAIPRGTTLDMLLSVQPKELIVVDPLNDFCFPLTDSAKKEQFVAACQDTPYAFHLDFFFKQPGMLTRRDSIDFEIAELSKVAHEDQCLYHLNCITPLLLEDLSVKWVKSGSGDDVKFSCLLPNPSENQKRMRDFLRSGIYDKKHKIMKETRTVLGAEQVTYFIQTPSALNLYELIFDIIRRREEFSQSQLLQDHS